MKGTPHAKNREKIVAVLLALVMVISICPITLLADDVVAARPTYTHYVPIGTSITGGYGLNHSYRNSSVGSFGNGAYPGLIADYFDIDSHYDGALLGTRGFEFRLALEDDLVAKSITDLTKIRINTTFSRHRRTGSLLRKTVH